MSSTWRRAIASVHAPANGAPSPSATDCGWIVTTSPRSSASDSALDRSGSTPITRIVGRSALTAAATPEISPPPPTPITSTSRSGTSSSDFEAGGPVTGDDRRVVEGVDERESFDVADPLHLGERVADVVPVEDDPRPVAQARIDLGTHCPGGHDDGHRHAHGRDRPTRTPARRSPPTA